MSTNFANRIKSVTELTRELKEILEDVFRFEAVSGEISNLRTPPSGHAYFTLKDGEAQLRCVLFRTQRRYLDIDLRDGIQVVCHGRVTIYEQRGEYQLVVHRVEHLGSGLLREAFEKLKASLAAEGLFDAAAKKRLPPYPAKVTLITSPDGAAVHDFIRTALRRYPGFPIEIYPSRVQGDGAAAEIAAALDILNERNDTDIIVLCRGGGSLEDLWSFNEELLARAISRSAIPVVSAVGHEIDFTIADFVADFRAATPTAAAEAVIPDRALITEKIRRLDRSLAESMRRVIDELSFRISSQRRMLGDPSILMENYSLRLGSSVDAMRNTIRDILDGLERRRLEAGRRLGEADPRRRLDAGRQRVSELARLAALLIGQRLASEKERLGRLAAVLDAVSPLAVLGRGYSLTLRKDGRQVVRDAAKVDIGEELEIILARGEIAARVTGRSVPGTGEDQ